MKTIFKRSVMALAAGILFSVSLNAKTDENPKTVIIADAHKAIKEHVKFPSLVINYGQEERVNVVFTVAEGGNVNFVIANTSNETLRKTIESQFMKLKLSSLKANNAYSVVFNFKTI
jgi:DNA/RNA endonuclease YhcR with UshA esterase domain